MINPAEIDLEADRWVACVRELPVVGKNLTGATFAMQIRLKPDATGAPLVDLATVASAASEGVRLVYGGTDTIANHIAAGRLGEVPTGYQSSDSVALSTLGIRINETTMEALPYPGEVGDDAELAWDIHVTPSGGLKDKIAGGKFIVRAGATQ